MYKYLLNEDSSNRTDCILRTADNAVIPNCAENRDWVAYQVWLAVPNTPDAG